MAWSGSHGRPAGRPLRQRRARGDDRRGRSRCPGPRRGGDRGRRAHETRARADAGRPGCPGRAATRLRPRPARCPPRHWRAPGPALGVVPALHEPVRCGGPRRAAQGADESPGGRTMIVLAGIPSEPPLARVADELSVRGLPFVWFDQRRAADSSCAFRLEDVAAVYWRLMDDRLLPELKGLPADAPQRVRCRSLHDAFVTWTSLTPARVVNRVAAMASNSSKPYQAQL